MTFPESEDTPPSKRLKLDDAVKASGTTALTTEVKSLLNFCDDILLEIFYNLRPIELYHLSKCCQRLKRIVCDRTLWENVDLTVPRMKNSQIEVFLDFLLPSTKSLTTRGTWDPPPGTWDGETVRKSVKEYVHPTILEKVLIEVKTKCPNLSSLVFENHVFDCDDIKFNLIWGNLPSGLEELAFRTCYLSKCNKYKALFSGIYESLPNLKKLDLSGSEWFQPHSFLALSKCKFMEELRLADCDLSDFVPYVSLSTRFGFQSLTVLDLRRTWVTDREVSCFNKTKTLRELYLASPGGPRGPYLISDLAVTSFGGSVDDWTNLGYITMFMEHFDWLKPSPLMVMELCDYRNVSDTSLQHCASCLKDLRRLNITGTSCSLNGVIDFKSKRPDVVIKSNFDSELLVDLGSSEETP